MNSKLFQRLLLSYLIISLIPIILGLIAYRNTLNVVERKTYENILQVLNQCQNGMDQRFSDVERVAMQLSMNDQLLKLSRSEKPDIDKEVTLKMLDARDQLIPTKMLNEDLLDLYVYLKRPGVVISSNYCFISLDKFYDVFFKYDGQDRETWANTMLNAPYRRRYFPDAEIMLRNGPESTNIFYHRTIVYAQALPLLGTQQGKILALISTENLDPIIEQFKSKDGWLSISDSGGQQLLISGSGVDEQLVFGLDAGINNEYKVKRVNDRDMLIVSTVSTTSGWRYTAALPHDQLLSTLHPLQWMVFLIIILGLVAVGGLAYLFTRYNMRPIYSLVGLLQGYNKIDSNVIQTDEYVFLNQQVSALMEGNSELRNRLSEHLPVMRNSVVSDWLDGEYTSRDQLQKALQRIDRIPRGPIALLLIRYDAFGLVDEPSRLEVAKTLCTQRIATISPEWNCHCDLRGNRQAVLFSPGWSEYRQQMETLAKELSRMVAIECGVEVRMAAHDLVSFPEGMPNAFKHTCDALERWDDGAIIRWPLQDIPLLVVQYPIRAEEKLILSIKNGRFEEAAALLDEIYDQNFQQRTLPLALQSSVVQGLRMTFLRLLQEFDSNTIPDSSAYQEQVLSLSLKNVSPKLIFGQLSHLIYTICEEVQTLRKVQLNKVLQPAISFIKENYHDSQLSLGQVAQHLGMSEAHLSRLFKEQIGVNYSDYVEQLRIDEACKLLDDGNTVDDVSSQVGYNSARVFRSAFKRVTGYNPSDYKTKATQSTTQRIP